MKIERLETHDRLQHLIKDQALNIAQGAEDCLKKNPLSIALQDRAPYLYLFAHPRTHDDGVTKRMLWQPRLTKPSAQTNSYLFRAQSKTDILEICWMIPPREMWPQYKKGNVTENQMVIWSIDQFQFNRKQLESSEKDDFKDERVRQIYKEIDREMKHDITMKKSYSEQNQ